MPAIRLLVVAFGASLLLTLGGCKSAQDRVLIGDDFYMQGNYSLALKEYRLARRKDPAIPGIEIKIERAQVRLYLQQGDALVARGDFSGARRAYEEVRRLDPHHHELEGRWTRLTEAEAEWHFRQGQYAMTAGDPFSAINEFERALEIQPDLARARAALDRAKRERSERMRRAEAAYERGVEAQRLGQLDEAIKHLDQALQLDPNHPGAALERASAVAERIEQLIDEGDASAEIGAWAEALARYEEARSRGASSHRIVSRIRHMRRELDAAEWIAKGDRARARNDWRTAYECYEQALLITTAPERAQELVDDARVTLVAKLAVDARAAELDGRFDEALSGYRAILDIQPRHRDASAWYDGLKDRIYAAEKAYHDGHAALRKRNLLLARQLFRECAEALPGYLDANERLEDVRREIQLAETMYDRGLEAQRAGNRERARLLYEECLVITTPFRDAEQRLEELFALAWTEHERYTPYEEACRAQARRDYERARTLLLKCRDERPGYRDVAERLGQIEAALETTAEAYRRAEEAARRHDLESARDEYIKCLTMSGSYRDALARLTTIEASLRLLREAERLELEHLPLDALERYRKVLEHHPGHPHAVARVTALDAVVNALEDDYNKMVAAEQKKDYREARRLAISIRNRCGTYRDVEDRIVRLEIEADYEDARSFEEAERWALASRAYERCVERDPDFRDARDRWNRARSKVGQGHPGVGRGPAGAGRRRSAQGNTDGE